MSFFYSLFYFLELHGRSATLEQWQGDALAELDGVQGRRHFVRVFSLGSS